MFLRNDNRPPEIYGILWVDWDTELWIRDILVYDYDVPEHTISNRLHLTVYYARRLLPGVTKKSIPVQIDADVKETRFMVLAPGGENPRLELEPSRRSVGIRLTRRNSAIKEVQTLRESMYQMEIPEIIGVNRKPTDAWSNAFGARHYQPHIKLLKPGSGISRDLTVLGEIFRSQIDVIKFNTFEVFVNTRRRF